MFDASVLLPLGRLIVPIIRIATFNVENLFSRVAYADNMAPGENHVGLYRFEDPDELKLARRIAEAVASDDKRQLTALALNEARADVVCLQEVDNANALKVFYERYLKPQIDTAAAIEKRALRVAASRRGPSPAIEEIGAIDRRHYFDWRQVIEGNDGRGIDVGIMSKYPIRIHEPCQPDLRRARPVDARARGISRVRRRQGAAARRNPIKLFRRDCLEVDIDLGSKVSDDLRLPSEVDVAGARENAGVCGRPRRWASGDWSRRASAAGRATRPGSFAATSTTTSRSMARPRLDEDGKPLEHALGPTRRSWIRRQSHGPPAGQGSLDDLLRAGRHLSQLDFILASPALAAANPKAIPEIIRGGQPYRARRYDGPRYPRVGWDRPKASDHSPVVVELAI